LANERFITVAKNNQGTAQEVFRQQVIASVAQLVGAYYDLVAFQLNVRVAQESLAAVNELVTETRKEEQIGVMSRLDVVTAESQLAARRRDLIVAQTNLQQQETTLKQLLSKINDPNLDSAEIVVTDPLPEPRESDIPAVSKALETALANRPELIEARNNLANQNTAIAYAKNNLLPSTSVFGLLAGAGLAGNTATTTGGAAGSLGNTFSFAYPEYAYGVSFAASIRNRSAQADNVLKERDLVSAQYAEVQVESAYAKAIIAMDQATGTTLDRNGIRLDDALSGTVSQKPTPDLNLTPTPGAGGAR
jgi:outer membrane protein TolC